LDPNLQGKVIAYREVPTAPDELPYDEDKKIPEGYELATRARKGMIIGGAVTFGGLWSISILTGTQLEKTSSNDDHISLYFPIVGPWVGLGILEPNTTEKVLLVVDGAGQVLGAALVAAGTFWEQSYLRRLPDADENDAPSVSVAPAPGGIILYGQF